MEFTYMYVNIGRQGDRGKQQTTTETSKVHEDSLFHFQNLVTEKSFGVSIKMMWLRLSRVIINPISSN